MEAEMSCEQLIKGLKGMSISAKHGKTSIFRLRFTKTDWDFFTEQGTLTNENGALILEQFCVAMRKQVSCYIMRKLQRSVSETETQHDFSLMASVKVILISIVARTSYS
jgi:hypothetical protein